MTPQQAAHWKVASDKEIASLKKRGVYELVPITSVSNGRNVIGTRWVYKIKADGVYKGRLVELGWSQVFGIDCGGIFAPVDRLQSIRIVLAIAAELERRGQASLSQQQAAVILLAGGPSTNSRCTQAESQRRTHVMGTEDA